MDASYLSVGRASDLSIIEPKSNPPLTPPGKILLALGIITLIGTLVATGCLYSQMGALSFAIGGGGIAFMILCVVSAKYCCVGAATDVKLPANKTTADIPITPTTEVKKPTQPEKPAALSTLPLEKIYELSDSLTEEQWKTIGDAHTLVFDFSKIEKSKQKKIFQILFNIEHEGYTLTERLLQKGETKAARLLPQCDISRIYELTPFFKEAHWPLIGEAHTLAFDFSKIEKSKRKQVFEYLFSWLRSYEEDQTRADLYLPKLPLSRIYELSPLFSSTHWPSIGEKHAAALDFSKFEEAKRHKIFNMIFNPPLGFGHDLFKTLTLGRIYELMPFFLDDQWWAIGDPRTLAFDFTKVEEPKRREAFNILFNTYVEPGVNAPSKAQRLLPQLTDVQKNIVRPYLEPEALRFLQSTT